MIRLAIAATCIAILILWFTSDVWGQLWGNPASVPEYHYVPLVRKPLDMTPPRAAVNFIDYNKWNSYIAHRAPTKMGTWDTPTDPGWEEILPPEDVTMAPLYTVLPTHGYKFPEIIRAYHTDPTYYHGDPFTRPHGVPEPPIWSMLLVGIVGVILLRKLFK